MKRANDLFANEVVVDMSFPSHSPKESVKVVVMGHTHNEKFEPSPQSAPVKNQFVNTGTWIENRLFVPNEPLRPTIKASIFPVKIELDPTRLFIIVKATEFATGTPDINYVPIN